MPLLVFCFEASDFFIFRFLISWLHQFNVLRKTKQDRLNNRKWIVISRWKMRHFIEVDVNQHQVNVIVHSRWRVEGVLLGVAGDLQNLKHLNESFVMFWFFSNIIQYKFIQSMVAYHCFCFNNIGKERHEEICHTIYTFNMHFSSGFFISIKARQRDIKYSTNACSTQIVLVSLMHIDLISIPQLEYLNKKSRVSPYN